MAIGVPAMRPAGKAGLALLHFPRAPGLLEAHVVVLCPARGPQVDDKGQDVECEDEGDDPLKVGGNVLPVGKGEDTKGNGQADFEEDEGELDPE